MIIGVLLAQVQIELKKEQARVRLKDGENQRLTRQLAALQQQIQEVAAYTHQVYVICCIFVLFFNFVFRCIVACCYIIKTAASLSPHKVIDTAMKGAADNYNSVAAASFTSPHRSTSDATATSADVKEFRSEYFKTDGVYGKALRMTSVMEVGTSSDRELVELPYLVISTRAFSGGVTGSVVRLVIIEKH